MVYKLNLLPEELRKSKSINTKAVITRLVVYSILAVLVIGELVFVSMFGTLKYKTTALQNEVDGMQPAVMQVQNLTAANTHLKEKVSAFEKLSAQSAWADYLENISIYMSENIWLTHMYIDANNNLMLEGNADKLSTIGNFMAGLRSIKGFTTINLISSTNNLNGIKFTISVGRGD